MANPTPGETAYAVWWRVRYAASPEETVNAYRLLSDVDRQAWEAAAQGVLTLSMPSEEEREGRELLRWKRDAAD